MGEIHINKSQPLVRKRMGEVLLRHLSQPRGKKEFCGQLTSVPQYHFTSPPRPHNPQLLLRHKAMGEGKKMNFHTSSGCKFAFNICYFT